MWGQLLLLTCLALTTGGVDQCHQDNVRFNGETQTQVLSRSAEQCAAECRGVQSCKQWTWNSGKCELKRSSKAGDKVGSKGAVSGERSCEGNLTVKAVECRYKDSNDGVFCLFPFVGESPGRKNRGGSRHESCLKTKRGHYWCATKVSLENRLLGTSDQRRDVDCGEHKNPSGNPFCSIAPPSKPKSSKITTKKPAPTEGTSPPKSPSAQTTKFSCRGRCGKPASIGSCQCNAQCQTFGDCCSDFSQQCSSITRSTARPTTTRSTSRPARPTSRPVTSRPSGLCPTTGKLSDCELQEFSEQLLLDDENNVARLLQLNTGCTTRVGSPRDCSTQPLFQRVDTSIFRKPVYAKLLALYNNYDESTSVKEDRTRGERVEEDQFLDQLMETKVMSDTLAFLRSNQLFTKSNSEFRKLLSELWFELYSRGNRILGSSGFEHVFLGEKKGGKVQGFHNWVYFYHLEKQDKLNYLGHWEEVKLGDQGTGLSFTFKWGQEQKPFASMLVGTSPELELALYTTCLLARGEDKCSLSLGGQPVSVTTHVFNRPGGVRYIASSFMDWKP